MDRPVLFCYDGSTGAKSALAVAAEVGAHPADAVVLTVWMPAAILLARGGSLGTAYVPDEGEIDEQEAAVAQRIPRDKRATVMGVFNAIYGLAWFGGSAILGVLYDLGPVYAVAFALALQWAACPLLYKLGRRSQA